jgi:uncharacterized protein
MSSKLLLATAAASAALLWSSAASAQDFDCRTASLPAEKAICANAGLARLDDKVAELYGRLWARLDNDGREGLRDYQLMFLNARNACRRDVTCIEGAYKDQIGVLSRQLEHLRFARR